MKKNPHILRTKLGQVKGLGSAHEGAHHWWLQRVTAVALIPLVVLFVLLMMGFVGAPREVFLAWLQNPFYAIFMMLLMVVAISHAYLGVQVVIEDYVHGPALKIATLLLMKFMAGIMMAVSVLAVIKILVAGF